MPPPAAGNPGFLGDRRDFVLGRNLVCLCREATSSPLKPQEPGSVHARPLSQRRARWGHCLPPVQPRPPRTRWAPSKPERDGGVLAVGQGPPEPPPLPFARFVSQRKGLFPQEPAPAGDTPWEPAAVRALGRPPHGFCFINNDNYRPISALPAGLEKAAPLTMGLNTRT